MTNEYAVQAYNSAGDGPWSDPASVTRITLPGIPKSVSAALDGNDILVSWTRPDSAHVSGYTVRHQAGDGQHVESDRLPESQTSFRMTGVSGDTIYRVAVRTHNAAGESSWSDDVEVMRRLAPSVPTNVAVSVGEADIFLSWEAPDTGTADGYHIQYGEQDSQELQTESLTAGQTSYTHAGSTEGVVYAYSVRAHNTAGQSPWSDPVTAQRLNLPQPPTQVTAAASGVDIIVSWEAPASGVTGSYEIRHGETDGAETTTASVTADETSYVHQSPQGDTSYTYHVRSVNDAGQSEWAGPAQATRVMPPSPPTGLSASISGNDIAVSWTTPSTGIIDRYEVEYLGPNSDEWTRDEVPSSTTSWTHAAPTPGTAYQYRARSVNSAGVSNWTASVSRTWYQGAAPPTSIGINMASSTYVVVQWATSTDRGVTYDMRTSVNGGTPTIQNTGTRAIKVDYYDAADTHREYAVRAVKDGTPGDWTHTIRASLTQPGQPTDFTVNLESKTSIRLHWSHPDTGEPYRYIVEKKKQGESNYTTDLAHNTSGFIRNKLLDGFDHDTTYHIRVRAQSHSGETSPAEGAREVTVHHPGT